MHKKPLATRDKIAQAVYKSIDYLVAGLLLSGQITASAVFITRDTAFGLSLTGAITGDSRSVAVDDAPAANVGIDVIDVITALLLILGEIHLIGVFIGAAGLFTFVVSGPPLGFLAVEAYAPTAKEFFADYREYVFERFQSTARS